MESQAIQGFQAITNEEVFENYAKSYNKEIVLHNYLAQWKAKHNKNRKYRRYDFYYDGFMYDPKFNCHNVLYIFDYKYNDRQSIRRISRMQNFISKHCLDSHINSSSISYILLNKTNSKCSNTKEYVKTFEKYILQEINIIEPTIIVCCGCYDIVSKLFKDYQESCFLSAIKNIPLVNMLPIDVKVSNKLFQLHFEYFYLNLCGWDI